MDSFSFYKSMLPVCTGDRVRTCFPPLTITSPSILACFLVPAQDFNRDQFLPFYSLIHFQLTAIILLNSDSFIWNFHKVKTDLQNGLCCCILGRETWRDFEELAEWKETSWVNCKAAVWLSRAAYVFCSPFLLSFPSAARHYRVISSRTLEAQAVDAVRRRCWSAFWWWLIIL